MLDPVSPAVARERMYVVIVGHVDHGKSTLVGRLLADTGALPDGKLEHVRALCERTGRRFEYAFLLDALKDEQAQGITIDVARVFFRTRLRDYVLLDAPGHDEFVRNMVTGAARAEAALLVIDAAEGVRENSRRHGTMLSLLGLSQVAVVVNKMDLVSWSRDAFRAIEAEYRAFLGRLGVEPAHFIPVSGRDGDFVATRSPRADWYDGPSVVEVLDGFAPARPKTSLPFRMPVQDVYRFTGDGDDRRIVAGTVATGTVAVGDEIAFFPSGKRSRVRSIEDFARQPPASASAGSPTGFTLTDQIYVARGELATRAGERPPCVTARVRASLFWLGKEPLVPEKDYLLRLGTARVGMRVERIASVMDASSLEPCVRPSVGRNEVAECTLALARPIACDVADIDETSRFVIVDDHEIRGGGILREALANDAALGAALAPRTATAKAPGVVIWLTGLSGAGKTTIAEALVARLDSLGRPVELLDGDSLRAVMPAGFTREERDAHVRRVAFLASRLEHHGVSVVAALISPYSASRARARALCTRFIEVHVSTPIEVCEARDVKGLYARARAGQLKGFTGIDDPYESPVSPELEIDTSRETLDRAVASIVELVERQEARWIP